MSELEQSKKRLDRALLRLDALIGEKAGAPQSGDNAAPLRRQNESLQAEIEAVHDENIRLREAMGNLSSRLDSVLAKLETVMEGSDEPTEDNG